MTFSHGVKMAQVIKDLEEALKREISKISTHYQARKCEKTIQTTFDTFTGEAVSVPIEASFYDENSGSNSVTYPRFDISFDLIQEDKTSGRMISIWEDFIGTYRTLIQPNQNRPKVYETVITGRDGQSDGDGIILTTIKASRVTIGNLVKILSGNNRGTYEVTNVDLLTGKLELNNELISDTEELSFNENTRKLYLLNPVDLFAVQHGDVFIDADLNEFKIQNVDTKKRELLLSGNSTPNLEVGGKVVRRGNILKNVDTNSVTYIVMDKNRPRFNELEPNLQLTDRYLTTHPSTPFNYHFTIEAKNKERQAHIETAERMTETVINRPRRAIQVLLRKYESSETEVTCGSKNGNGFQVKVADASCFCVNDSVHFVNRYDVSDNNQIIDIDYNTGVITLRNRVHTQYDEDNNAKLVSNADMKYWSLYLNNGSAIIAQDSINNFYRQEYSIRIEGWKVEKTGEKDSGGITEVKVTLETPSKLVEEF
jgi:hypothetical protein